MEKSSKRERSSRTTLTDGIIMTAAAATLAGLMYAVYYTVRRKKNPSSSSEESLRAKKHRALIPTKLLNKYHLGELLGEGTYACVFCAGLKNDEISPLMGYAIKVIPRSILVQGHVHNFDPEFLESELAILKFCQHKNILSLIDSQWTKDALVFVTERAFGGVLFDKILEIDHYDDTVAKDIFCQLVEAVRYLHDEAAVIHRDLKPENILLMETGTKTSVRICDFGVSKMWTSSSQTVSHGSSATVQKRRSTQLRQAAFRKKSLRTKTVTGTPGYQAPEMMDGGTSYGTEVDIWSLGIILHAMLCGALPADFGAPKFDDTVWNHVSIDAKDLITSMLQEDPNQRPSAAKLLKSKWLNGGIGSTTKNPKELWKLVQSKLRVESEKSKLKS